MEWQQVLGFYHTAKLGSFTKAAEATFRTQSALTQQIKALEEEFGCLLFERIGKRKLLLTPEGEKFFELAGVLLTAYNRFVEDMSDSKGLGKGRLRIAAPFTTLYHLLPNAVRNFNERFPSVELSLLDRSQREAIELVKAGEADFGVALEGIVPGELTRFRWRKIEPVLLTVTGHPLAGKRKVSLKQIAQYPLILPPKGGEFSKRDRLEELFRKEGLHYRVVMESSNIELSSLYVEMGLGVSFASIAKGLKVLKQRKLAYVSLDRFFDMEQLCVITRKNKRMTASQAAFLKILLDTSGQSD